MNIEARARTVCTACDTLVCRELRDDIGVRQIEGIDGTKVQNYPESVFNCGVLRDEIEEYYFLWVLGLQTLMEIYCEEATS
jgi:hypothetical protein